MLNEERVTTKEDLVNDLIFYTQRMEEIWKFHPSNPEKINIEKEYQKLEQLISEVKENLQDYD